jgi:MFS family permease
MVSYPALFATFQVLGQFAGGWQSDYFGRRICLYTVIFWTYIGVILEVVATDWKVWLASKIVVGFATGIMQSVVPTYVAEVAPRELRAIGLSFFNMCMK